MGSGSGAGPAPIAVVGAGSGAAATGSGAAGAAATGSGATVATSGCLVMAAVRSSPGWVNTPVSPIGVMCVLCWPAPIAGLVMYGFGGSLWATATLMTATVERPASRPAHLVNALMR